VKKRFFAGLIVMFSIFAFLSCPLDDTAFIPKHVDVEGVTLDRDSVTLNFSSGTLQSGNKVTLNALITPSNASNKTVSWSTSDPEIVQVVNGVVTAIGEGSAVITVTTQEGEFKDHCEVLVLPSFFYSQFGAIGDGVTDDYIAIRNTHAEANLVGAHVRADPGKTFLIGNAPSPIIIQTNTDWTGAYFILDDTRALNATQWVFSVNPSVPSVNVLERLNPRRLSKNQSTVILDPPFEHDVLLYAIDSNVRRYRRSGTNATQGDTQRDVFIIDKDGKVDMSAPIIWDFDAVTTLTAFHIDKEELRITGGHFTTIPNNSGTGYMRRGIRVQRSNTVIDRIHHTVNHITPYRPYYGFLYFRDCVNVTVQNSTLTGKWYNGSTGTYGLMAEYTINFSVINCVQTNSITDSTFWGVFASNYSKNIIFDRVNFSRFDAHRGVHNTTIRNSTFGWQGILIIGSGILRVENTTVSGAHSYISFRPDYGSHWEGDVFIKDAIFQPGSPGSARIINTDNNGQHDYGYPTTMPRIIDIDGFHVVDGNIPNNGVELVVNHGRSSAGSQAHPYTLTETIYIRNFSSQSHSKWRFSNSYLNTRIDVVER
jgi:hypothetical protein